MCYFITIATRAEKASLATEIFGRDFRLVPTAHPTVMAALPAGYAALLLTNGHCSCGMYASPQSVSDVGPEERLRKKYAKLGWSDAKISRAIGQAKASGTKGLHPRGLAADVVSGLTALCHAAGGVAVVVHWYSGDVETEALSLTRAKPCDCAEFYVRASTLCEDAILIMT